MNVQEALNIFGLSGEVTEADIKKAFKRLAVKFHPDKNPLGAEMMKMINTANDFLMSNLSKINEFKSLNLDDFYDYSEEMIKVLNALSALNGIEFEVIGNWAWISGDTKTHKEALSALGCRWAPKKKKWFYRPAEHKSRFNRTEHTMDEIRQMYGTSVQRKSGSAQVALKA